MKWPIALVAFPLVVVACSSFDGTAAPSEPTLDSGTPVAPLNDAGDVVDAGDVGAIDSGADATVDGPCADPNLFCNSFDPGAPGFGGLLQVSGSDGTSGFSSGYANLTVPMNRHSEVYATTAYPYGSTLDVEATVSGCAQPSAEVAIFGVYDLNKFSGVRALVEPDGTLKFDSSNDAIVYPSVSFGPAPAGWFHAQIVFGAASVQVTVTPDGGEGLTLGLVFPTDVKTPSYFIGPSSPATTLNADCTVSFDWMKIVAKSQ